MYIRYLGLQLFEFSVADIACWVARRQSEARQATQPSGGLKSEKFRRETVQRWGPDQRQKYQDFLILDGPEMGANPG